MLLGIGHVFVGVAIVGQKETLAAPRSLLGLQCVGFRFFGHGNGFRLNGDREATYGNVQSVREIRCALTVLEPGIEVVG